MTFNQQKTSNKGHHSNQSPLLTFSPSNCLHFLNIHPSAEINHFQAIQPFIQPYPISPCWPYWFSGDLRCVAWFGSFWRKQAKLVWAKSNHLQAGSSKSMCSAVSWSRWGLIWDLLGYFGSIWVGNNVQGGNLWSLNFWVHEVKKFKFGNAESMGCWCRNGSISLKVQIFWEGSTIKLHI